MTMHDAGQATVAPSKTPGDHLEQRRAELLARQDSAQAAFEHHARERHEHGCWCEVLELELASIRAALEQLDMPKQAEAPSEVEPPF